ncbi:hypothetical protein ACIHFD_22090 [Nonomuraea sp. NPDC051941]|uniref:phosphoketolase family protein n=1 Tax=Nonomuraea sp. NPDC051941 TaxID=3364373 RepID=UPI0037CBEFA7
MGGRIPTSCLRAPGTWSPWFRELFTDHVDVLFAFHGYPGAIHQPVHGRPGPDRFHVRGFVDEGTTTTPFDMVVRNRASRYHLVIDARNAARRTPTGASELKAWREQQLLRHERLRGRALAGHAGGAGLVAGRLGGAGLSAVGWPRGGELAR